VELPNVGRHGLLLSFVVLFFPKRTPPQSCRSKEKAMNPNSLAFFSLESQFPTAAVALELLFRLRLDGCASAVWTLHRTNLSHEIPHAFQSLFISQTIKTCLSVSASKKV
jgi:hypothetical protein